MCVCVCVCVGSGGGGGGGWRGVGKGEAHVTSQTILLYMKLLSLFSVSTENFLYFLLFKS